MSFKSITTKLLLYPHYFAVFAEVLFQPQVWKVLLFSGVTKFVNSWNSTSLDICLFIFSLSFLKFDCSSKGTLNYIAPTTWHRMSRMTASLEARKRSFLLWSMKRRLNEGRQWKFQIILSHVHYNWRPYKGEEYLLIDNSWKFIVYSIQTKKKQTHRETNKSIHVCLFNRSFLEILCYKNMI